MALCEGNPRSRIKHIKWVLFIIKSQLFVSFLLGTVFAQCIQTLCLSQKWCLRNYIAQLCV